VALHTSWTLMPRQVWASRIFTKCVTIYPKRYGPAPAKPYSSWYAC
jgi:hypothetical protein